MKNSTLTAALAIALAGMSAQASAQSYRVTDLGAWGGYSSRATGINNAGQITGIAGGFDGNAAVLADANGYQILTSLGNASGINNAGQVVGTSRANGSDIHATLWNGGTRVDLSASDPQYRQSYAEALNNNGLVVGANNSHAAVWNNGAMTLLNSGYSWAKAVNDNGVVVGNATYGAAWNAPSYATQWQNGVQTSLGSLAGSTRSYAYGINNAGQVVGGADDGVRGGYQAHAVLFSGGSVTDLGTLGGNTSRANDINEAGLIVGFADSVSYGDRYRRATLWNGTTAIDLNSLLVGGLGNFSYLMEATAINDLGQIVGYGFFADRSEHAFLLTPTIPEPSTYTMTLAGLGLFGLVARRRKRA
ncbi:PEP-CTERM sorting domain-containing protein [Oxalobacteraceae bacterium]|nr:PEP-CTERM sorting domain-containing protein [Oxalobacteraceae bacterium]